MFESSSYFLTVSSNAPSYSIALSIDIYSVKYFFSPTNDSIFVIYLFKFGIKFLLTCSANLTIFFYEFCYTFDIAVSRLDKFCNNKVWYPFTFLGIYLSVNITLPLLLSIILQTCPINATFYLILVIFLSIFFNIFIC